MKKTKKIQDYNGLYDFLRYYVDYSFKLAYRKIKYVGRENIPADGSVIYAPNHTNALMDALIVLAIDHKAKVFVARADMFKNRKFAKILKFLKIMPIMRIRDGMDEVRKNNETIDKAVDVLMDKVPFCILPEGTHRAKHSLLPLSKGIFRIAFSAHEYLNDSRPLYIVPIGIEYGNYFRLRSTVLVNIGKPINVGEFLALYKEHTAAEITNIMRDELTKRMKELIIYIQDDENYDATVSICAAVFRQEHKKRGLVEKSRTNNAIISRLTRAKEQQPELAGKLFAKGAELEALRTNKKISLKSIAKQHSLTHILLNTIIFTATLPYTLFAAILSAPLNALTALILGKVSDRAFHNSIRFVLTLVLWPILLIIYAAIAYSLLPWELALPLTLASVPSTVVCQDAWRLLRIIVSDIKLSTCKRAKQLIKELSDTFNQIMKLL